MYPPSNARRHTTNTLPHRKPARPPSLRNLANQFAQSASTPTSRLLFSAATVALSRTWIGHVHEGEGDAGGAGWLILGYWGGKIIVVLRESWSGRKGKGKARDTGSSENDSLVRFSYAFGSGKKLKDCSTSY
jgi:hypothetical protein